MENRKNSSRIKKIGIIGLGYVGLPLAISFGARFNTVGYDLNKTRLNELVEGVDKTGEVTEGDLLAATKLTFSSELSQLEDCDVYIITVPTPVNKLNEPDLSFLIRASEDVGSMVSIGDLVIYESTVYPGCTMEICLPILEANSKLRVNNDFMIAYSPERINPGDKTKRLKDIPKLVAGSNQMALEISYSLYSQIIDAGLHKCDSIEIAEAAKVIENAQRDINIAFINELAIIFSKLSIPTHKVLEAASTKWNFLQFSPGLVGGHCIGVDPYYLSHKAEAVGISPRLILAGRNLNNQMHVFFASEIDRVLQGDPKTQGETNVLLCGVTFKENCPDIRNSGSLRLVKSLGEMGYQVTCFDPLINAEDLGCSDISLVKSLDSIKSGYAAIVFVVAHDIFREIGLDVFKSKCDADTKIFDLKNVFADEEVDWRV